MFAHDDDDLPFAGLLLGGAAINALRDLILRLHMAAKISAVDCVFAARKFGVALFGLDDLPQLMCQHESRFVLAIQIAAQLEGAMSFGPVREDRDGKKVISD